MRCSITDIRRRLVPVVLLVTAAAAAPATAAERRVADPGGGAAWVADVTDSRGGRTCVVLRQGSARKGRSCERLGFTVPYAYNVRIETPPDRARWRTVFTIVLSREVISATLATPDGVRRYRRGVGPRVLLVVLAGRVDQPPLEVRVRGRGGRVLVTRGGADPAAEVADPLGEPGWRALVEERSRRRTCVTWERVTPRFGGPPAEPTEGPFRCGDPSVVFPAVGVDRVSGRVVISGLVGPGVSRVELRGPDDPALAFDRTSRSILAVLPESADPATLTLVATLANGRTVERPLT